MRLGYLFFPLMLVGCVNAKTSIDVSAKVTVTDCVEDRSDLSQEDVTLRCPKIEGQGTVRIRFPRRAWWAIKAYNEDGKNYPGK